MSWIMYKCIISKGGHLEGKLYCHLVKILEVAFVGKTYWIVVYSGDRNWKSKAVNKWGTMHYLINKVLVGYCKNQFILFIKKTHELPWWSSD